MSRELHEAIADELLGVLQGGWARYLEIEDGTQIRTEWHREGDLEWLRVTNPESGHVKNFTVKVIVEPLLMQEIGPEDDGALQAELSEEERAGVRDTFPCWECLVDPNEDPRPWCDCGLDETCKGPCRHRAHAPSDCPNRPQRDDTWAEVMPDDHVRGEDGSWYEVVFSKAGVGPNAGKQVVTMIIARDVRTYNMPPDGPVRIKRGVNGAALDTLRGNEMNPEVLR